MPTGMHSIFPIGCSQCLKYLMGTFQEHYQRPIGFLVNIVRKYETDRETLLHIRYDSILEVSSMKSRNIVQKVHKYYNAINKHCKDSPHCNGCS